MGGTAVGGTAVGGTVVATGAGVLVGGAWVTPGFAVAVGALVTLGCGVAVALPGSSVGVSDARKAVAVPKVGVRLGSSVQVGLAASRVDVGAAGPDAGEVALDARVGKAVLVGAACVTGLAGVTVKTGVLRLPITVAAWLGAACVALAWSTMNSCTTRISTGCTARLRGSAL